jgi:hypothetical protein
MKILFTKPACMEWLLKEVFETEVHPSNINWEDALILGQARETTHSLLWGV